VSFYSTLREKYLFIYLKTKNMKAKKMQLGKIKSSSILRRENLEGD